MKREVYDVLMRYGIGKELNVIILFDRMVLIGVSIKCKEEIIL